MKNFWYVILGIGAIVIIILVVVLMGVGNTPAAPVGGQTISQASSTPPQSAQPIISSGNDALVPKTSSTLPSCDDLHIPKEKISAAVIKAMATGKYNNAWGDTVQFKGLFDAVEKDLGCNLNQKLPTPIVTYAAGKFSPSPVTIQAGDTVTFINNSSRSIDIASDPHPTHTGYPAAGGCVGSTFDACGPIASGAKWSFTFDIKGSWGYHNHFAPSERGMVIVQ